MNTAKKTTKKEEQDALYTEDDLAFLRDVADYDLDADDFSDCAEEALWCLHTGAIDTAQDPNDGRVYLDLTPDGYKAIGREVPKELQEEGGEEEGEEEAEEEEAEEEAEEEEGKP